MNRKHSLSLLDRFEEKIERIPECGCWIWMGSSALWGYGQIWVVNRVMVAHRASWEMFNGPIPKGMCVLHKCDTPPCVNPYHLFLGTKSDNTQDMLSKKRENRHSRARGEQHGSVKLKESDVVKILRDRRVSPEVAKDYGVSDSQIRGIKRRECWAHVNPERIVKGE